MQVRLELNGLEARGDGWVEPCSTTIQAAGAYVIVIETVMLGRGVALSSCYLADLSGRTGVSHLRKPAAAPTAITQRVLDVMAGETHARACLLDHTAELRAMLDDDGAQGVSVEVDDRALTQAASVWRRPQL